MGYLGSSTMQPPTTCLALSPLLSYLCSKHVLHFRQTRVPWILSTLFCFRAFLCLGCFFSRIQVPPPCQSYMWKFYSFYKARLKYHFGQEGFPDVPNRLWSLPPLNLDAICLAFSFCPLTSWTLSKSFVYLPMQFWEQTLALTLFSLPENSACSRGLVIAWWIEFGGTTWWFYLLLIMSLIPRQNEICFQDAAETKLLQNGRYRFCHWSPVPFFFLFYFF